MKRPITLIKPPTINNSFEDDRFSDRVSDRVSFQERLSDRISITDTKFELNQNSLDRLRSLTFKKIVKNLSLCGDEQITNNTFDDFMSCHNSLDNQGILLNPNIIDLFKNEKDLMEFIQDQKNKFQLLSQKNQERQIKIQRYKNKKRNWEKTINYRCRKIVADTRLRIKGRFISKKDTETISSLAKQKDVDQLFDSKRNLDIDKFHDKTQIFRGVPNPKSISKRQILRTIHDEADFKIEQQMVKNRLEERKPIWQLVHRRQKIQVKSEIMDQEI